MFSLWTPILRGVRPDLLGWVLISVFRCGFMVGVFDLVFLVWAGCLLVVVCFMILVVAGWWLGVYWCLPGWVPGGWGW